MKKIITFILALLALSLLPVSTAYADVNYVNNGGTASSTLTYHEQSTYTIIVPETIDAVSDNYTFAASDINITDNEHIVIRLTNSDQNSNIVFTHENGENTIHKRIFSNASSELLDLHPNCVGYFNSDSTDSIINFAVTNASDEYQSEYAKAGDYTATADFEISLIQD